MEKRVSYYVSRKSFLVWLSALVMTASAALRIAYSCGKGADASTVWFQIVLPVAACLIFVLMILLGGEERFYRTAIPAFMLAIYYSVRVSAVLPSLSLRFVFWVAYLAMPLRSPVACATTGRWFCCWLPRSPFWPIHTAWPLPAATGQDAWDFCPSFCF